MKADWLDRMSQEMRRFGRQRPIDDLLPELEAGNLGGEGAAASQMDAAGPPPELPELDAGNLGGDGAAASQMDAAGPPPELSEVEAVALAPAEPEPLPAADPSEGFEPGIEVPEQTSPEAMQAEIAEFMDRNRKDSVDDDDLAEFLSGGIDPNTD